MKRKSQFLALTAAFLLAPLTPAAAQAPGPAAPPASQVAVGVQPPPGYVIGPSDVLAVLFWRDQDMSAEVAVRPDGRITLPLLNEVFAAGLTPEELREVVAEKAGKYVEDPTVTVVVKEIHSRKVFITGQVANPGAYDLGAPMTVMQLIAMAGGLLEYAKGNNIIVMRTEAARPIAHRFNYREVLQRRNLRQNIELKPGDTVVVP